MLRGQERNFAVRLLDRARLAATARRSNTCIHGGIKPVLCVRDLFAFPGGAVASVSNVFLDEVDVVKHRVEDILLRGDGEFSAIEARCQGVSAAAPGAAIWSRRAVVSPTRLGDIGEVGAATSHG